MARDMASGWRPEPSVEVFIPRCTFGTFAMRTDEKLLAHVQMFKVEDQVAHTVVHLMPYHGHVEQLVAGLKLLLEPGETIQIGSQSWTKEVAKLCPAWAESMGD